MSLSIPRSAQLTREGSQALECAEHGFEGMVTLLRKSWVEDLPVQGIALHAGDGSALGWLRL